MSFRAASPGERLIRYFQPETFWRLLSALQDDGPGMGGISAGRIAEYQIKTADGPRSQKDAQANGRLGFWKYRIPIHGEAMPVFEVHSPYVIVDARFEFYAVLTEESQTLLVEEHPQMKDAPGRPARHVCAGRIVGHGRLSRPCSLVSEHGGVGPQ